MAAFSAYTVHSNNNQLYHVFINHRGPDTKLTFARSLYVRLLSNRVSAFLDQEELQKGYSFPSQIENAIVTASVHVAILSPGYAESNWCLDELVRMLETKAPIIPVFYGVTPAEVRWTRGKNGKYAQALQKLEEKKTYDPQTQEKKSRYDSNTIENWRNALSEVADISGFELEARNIGEEVEVELVDKVVKRLSEMLRKPDLYVAKFPTGLDEKLKDFEDTVQLEQQRSGGPQILGIWGLGGTGKTTLAKEFFNRKNSEYHRSCFLYGIKDSAANGTLNSLQKELFRSLTSKDEPVSDVAVGKGMLIEPLKSCKALVILDDVDDANQVEAVLPVQIHSDSLILITSRDKHILRSSRVEHSCIYRLIELNPEHSRVLFCSYAFSQPYPIRGFESIVDQFLKACKGLPLSLKVFGALLYGRDISDWQEELGSLQQILPDEIRNTFMISYNSLNIEEKDIFLDIACFFNGRNKDTAIGIWNRSGWRGARGFQNLQNKCLVEADSWNTIHMHDHVRDLRIEVAECSCPRRLWRRTKNVVRQLLFSEIRSVRGIRMVHGERDGNDEDDVFGLVHTEKALLESIFRRLQILDTENALLERILRRVELPDLIWFRWKNCPHSSLPSWIPIKNLRVLEVSDSVLKTLWQREGESQASIQLPVYLEELWADGCVQMKSIQGLAQLTKLRLLIVSGCSELEELPSMDALVSLEELWADGCAKLKSVRGSVRATKLRLLRVGGCSELEELPSMDALVCLEELWADGCEKLKSIRGSVPATKLRLLRVGGCSELEELPSMETLESLEELWADGCAKLKTIRGSLRPTKLRLLRVGGCSELEELPSMETLESLEELWADGCAKLKSIRGSLRPTKLRLLRLGGCSELEELPSMETLVSLEEVWADGCGKLKSIRGSVRPTKLRLLCVGGCSELEELPSMETLLSLEELWADGCVKLKSIRGSAQPTRLRLLRVWRVL